MKPGPELDALVCRSLKLSDHGLKGGCAKAGHFLSHLPYSTQIAVAWKLVEKLGKPLEIGMHGDNYVVSIHGCVGISRSVSHAICLAALNAVGVQVQEAQ